MHNELSNYPLQKIKSALEKKCVKNGKEINKVHKLVTRLSKRVEVVERQNRGLHWQNRVLYSLIVVLICYILIKINI